MAIFKTKDFARIAKRLSISDDDLKRAVERAEGGLIDADYRGGVIKQRLPIEGRGRSGGYRTLIVFRAGHRAVFVDALAKNEDANFDDRDIALYRKLAKIFLQLSAAEVAKLVDAGEWKEIDNES